MNLDDLQRLSPLLGGLATDELGLLAAQASNRRFGAGQTMFNEDARADVFYILEQGTVGLELSSPGRPDITIQTLGAGDLVGISWLFPPVSLELASPGRDGRDGGRIRCCRRQGTLRNQRNTSRLGVPGSRRGDGTTASQHAGSTARPVSELVTCQPLPSQAQRRWRTRCSPAPSGC